jgi:hypothetical protein
MARLSLIVATLLFCEGLCAVQGSVRRGVNNGTLNGLLLEKQVAILARSFSMVLWPRQEEICDAGNGEKYYCLLHIMSAVF